MIKTLADKRTERLFIPGAAKRIAPDLAAQARVRASGNDAR